MGREQQIRPTLFTFLPSRRVCSFAAESRERWFNDTQSFILPSSYPVTAVDRFAVRRNRVVYTFSPVAPDMCLSAVPRSSSSAAVMVFQVLYLITAFELILYGCMVANRQWLFSSYHRPYATYHDGDPYFGEAAAAADDDDDDYDYDSLVMDD